MILGDWRTFDTLRRDRKALWEECMPRGFTTRVNIFKARFDVAARFVSMKFEPEFSEGTTRMYSAGTRLLLAYSASEALVQSEDVFRGRKGASVTSWSISRVSLANELRPVARLVLDNICLCDNLRGTTIRYLSEFCEGGQSNIRPIATALRHVHAHGGFTARSLAGINSDSTDQHVAAIEALAMALLERCDEKFSRIVRDAIAALGLKA
jgi:hypothetical protein